MNQDGFSGTRFAGKHIKMLRKRNACLLDDSQIFNIKFFQHIVSPSSVCIQTAYCFAKKAACSSDRSKIKMVSSPAIVPTMRWSCLASTAAQIACAVPERQCKTAICPA